MSTIGAIFRRTLPATSTRMRLLVKSFYSSFSSFIFSYEATAYQDVNFERVLLWIRFLYIVENLLLVNHQNFTISRAFSFFPPSSVLVADKTGWLSLRVYTGQNTTTWISACKFHSASNQRTKQTCIFHYKRDPCLILRPHQGSEALLSYLKIFNWRTHCVI